MTAVVSATPGSLDSSFGTSGKVTTAFAGGEDYARALAIQADGKIVICGEANTGGGDDFALARYNADGSLDTGFGTGGKVTTAFAGSLDWARAIAIQPDGRIVVAGHSGSGNSSDDFALARYLTDGSLDTSFSSDGKVTVNMGVGDNGLAIALQSDGKIVVAGSANTGGTAAIARFNTDGSLDNSFSGDGMQLASFGL